MVNCGLVTDMNKPVPLKSVEVDVQVQGHVATVSSTLLYVNGEERPLEAVFVFPLPGDCALCHFSAKIGDKEVVAKLQDKQKAREEYDDALSSGHQAFLLEKSYQSPDIFKLDVGNLPPAGSATITLVYISELAMQADDALRFCLPAVLNPRYTPPGMDRSNMATVTSVPADTVPYTLALRAHLYSPLPISKVESNCSLEPLEYLSSDKTEAKVQLSSGHMFDREVELLLYYQDAHKPTAIVEAGQHGAEPGSLMRDPVVMLSCYPEIPATVTSSLDSCGEFIFLVDQSGSMGGKMHSGSAVPRIEHAKDTLLLILKSLPTGCYFNIYGFGSQFTHFFKESVEYSQKTMEYALLRVKALRADLGGTQILQPLQHIYSQPCLPKHPRQLFIFTDGEVGNTKDVLDLVKVHVGSHRCFSFGIGEGASTALITGLAKEGGGHAQFITGSVRMQPKVMQSLRYALQPTIKDISVEWNLPDGMSVTSLSPPLKVLFHGQRALLYAQIKGEGNGSPEGSVTIQYRLMEETVKNRLSMCLKPSRDTGETLHQLGARALIRSLEMEERDVGPSGSQAAPVRERLLQLSLQSGVICTHTAFIAIHKATGQAVQGPLLRRTVPTPACGSIGTYAIPSSCSLFTGWPVMMGVMGGSSLHGVTFPPPAQSEDTYEKAKRKRKATGLMVMDSAPVMEQQQQQHQQQQQQQQVCYGGRLPPSNSFNLGRSHDLGGVCYGGRLPPSNSFNLGRSHDLGGVCYEGMLPPSNSFNLGRSHDLGGANAPVVLALQSHLDPLLQLISLQRASGSWDMDSCLAKVLGKTDAELAKNMPDGVDKAVWATVVALIWLYGLQLTARDEWILVAMKAVSWIQAQRVSCVPDCVQAGNALLGCQVQQETLGL